MDIVNVETRLFNFIFISDIFIEGRQDQLTRTALHKGPLFWSALEREKNQAQWFKFMLQSNKDGLQLDCIRPVGRIILIEKLNIINKTHYFVQVLSIQQVRQILRFKDEIS